MSTSSGPPSRPRRRQTLKKSVPGSHEKENEPITSNQKRKRSTRSMDTTSLPPKKRKIAKFQQIVFLKDWCRFGFGTKTNAMCLAYNNSYYTDALKTKLKKMTSKTKMFELKLIDQMLVMFTFIGYLPMILQSRDIKERFNAVTLSKVNSDTIQRFVTAYNANADRFPTDILAKTPSNIQEQPREELLSYLDQLFKQREFKKQKWNLLKYICCRTYKYDPKKPVTIEQLSPDWDRAFIYRHFCEEESNANDPNDLDQDIDLDGVDPSYVTF